MKASQQRVAVPSVVIEAEVARRIRQHGRSSLKNEVCGILIGREHGTTTQVDACIPGLNAAQGGAHVTFTQETWEHIYSVKDRDYPDDRIVGWYHSHPGFGVFLSDHDLFIQQNFFSSPRQIAWVYDPHSDEEGCFGWHKQKIDKIEDVHFRYVAGLGEVRDLDDQPSVLSRAAEDKKDSSWVNWLFSGITYLLTLILGAAILWWWIQPLVVSKQQAYEVIQEAVLRSYARDCGKLPFIPPAPGGPASPSQELPNGPKR